MTQSRGRLVAGRMRARFIFAGMLTGGMVVAGAPPAFATQALNNGQKISTTSAKLLQKSFSSLTGSQQNVVICDPATPLIGSTSLSYEGFSNVVLTDIVAGPGYEVDYHHSWIQLETFGFGEATSPGVGKIGTDVDPSDIVYQKLDAYLLNGNPSFTSPTGYIQVKFNKIGDAGAFDTGGTYTSALTGLSYDLSKYLTTDTDGIQFEEVGGLTSGGVGKQLVPVEFDNYLAVFDTPNDDPENPNLHTYTHFGNTDGPGGPDLLTDPSTGEVYDPNRNEVQSSTVITVAPEPSIAAFLVFASGPMLMRRRSHRRFVGQ